MAGYTPGPWEITQEVVIDGGVRCINREAGPAMVPCNFPEGTPEGDRADADLCLTATAPDLYEALVDLLERAEVVQAEAPRDFSFEDGPFSPALLARARAAVAKATEVSPAR
jgi:hypothetical protein